MTPGWHEGKVVKHLKHGLVVLSQFITKCGSLSQKVALLQSEMTKLLHLKVYYRATHSVSTLTKKWSEIVSLIRGLLR